MKAIQEEMERELKADNKNRDGCESKEELEFLDKIPQYDWTQEERRDLCKPISADEIWGILEKEVDLDSSPGEDGITYRCLKHFLKNNQFEELYLSTLNETREEGSFGKIRNNGVMVIKNKKKQSIEYEEREN